jgi:hypothetical protein
MSRPSTFSPPRILVRTPGLHAVTYLNGAGAHPVQTGRLGQPSCSSSRSTAVLPAPRMTITSTTDLKGTGAAARVHDREGLSVLSRGKAFTTPQPFMQTVVPERMGE